jgi:hypothetical protein
VPARSHDGSVVQLARELSLAGTLLALSSCSTSSGSQVCNEIATFQAEVRLSIQDAAGGPVCDAYVTKGHAAFCTWNGCVCKGIDAMTARQEFLTISRPGYQPVQLTVALTDQGCGSDEHLAGSVQLTTTAAGNACYKRDSDFCSDHRVCYDGADPGQGCVSHSETSPEPSAAYFCCN